MSRISRFEEIEGWIKARKPVSKIHAVSAQGALVNDIGSGDQLERASLSVKANIAEGFDSGSQAEFRRFLSFAVRSLSEVQSHLYIALDQRTLAQERFQQIYTHAEALRRILREVESACAWFGRSQALEVSDRRFA